MWRQRRARDPGLRIGLDDLGHGNRDIEVRELRLFNESREFLRSETVPPVHCGQGRIGVPRRGTISTGHVQQGIGMLCVKDAA